MRYAVITTPGGPDSIQFATMPTPEPVSGQVRVAIDAAGVNAVDAQTRSGLYHQLGWVTSPQIGLGWDLAGRIDAVGPDVSGFTVGDPVAASAAGIDKPVGSYAEAIILPVELVAHRPAGLDAVSAATVPLNAGTASQGLDLLGPAQGRRLLITGAAGAVGGYAAQLAVERGFEVAGLARPRDHDFVASTGADPLHLIPTRAVFDAVLDAAVLGEAALSVVLDHGQYVGVIPGAAPQATRAITVAALTGYPDAAQLTTLLARTAAGELPVRINQVLPLPQAARAHRLLESGGLRGRIVLQP